MRKIILSALRQRTTWAALFLILGGFGVSTHPILQEAITTIGTQAADHESANGSGGE